MALNFLEAIVDVGKTADVVTIAKLKSHSKVGYQDHPMGEASCSTCSMFTPAEKSPDGEPSCSLVKPPISPHGWCEDYDAHDRSDDVRERLASMLGVEFGDDGAIVAKDGPPDEPRDERGRWTAGAVGPAAATVAAEGRRTSLSGLSPSDLSNLRSALRDAAYGPKAVADAARRVQDWYESQAATPKGYHWENGKLVEDDPGVAKDGPPDEPRDDRGRWITGGGGPDSVGRVGGASARYTSPYRTRVRAYIPGAELPKVRAEQQMREAEQKVADLQRQLSEHSQDKSEDLYWGIHRMLQQARDDLASLKSRIPTQKAFNQDEPRDDRGRWTVSGASVDSSINADQMGKLKEAGKFLGPNRLGGMHLRIGSVGSNLATITGNDVSIHPGLFKEHPAKIAAVLFHEAVHHDQPAGLSANVREAQAYAHTAVWAQEKLNSTSAEDAAARNSLTSTRDYEAKQAERYRDRAIKEITKVFNPDEPRDEIGRWTSGDGGPDHPDFMHGSEGEALAGAMGDVAQGMHDSISAIEDAHSNLEAASSTASDHADEEDDALEQGAEQNPKDPGASAIYLQWDNTNNANLADVADKTMALRNAVADHLQATAGVLSQLDARIQQHANENGKRGG